MLVFLFFTVLFLMFAGGISFIVYGFIRLHQTKQEELLEDGARQLLCMGRGWDFTRMDNKSGFFWTILGNSRAGHPLKLEFKSIRNSENPSSNPPVMLLEYHYQKRDDAVLFLHESELRSMRHGAQKFMIKLFKLFYWNEGFQSAAHTLLELVEEGAEVEVSHPHGFRWVSQNPSSAQALAANNTLNDILEKIRDRTHPIYMVKESNRPCMNIMWSENGFYLEVKTTFASAEMVELAVEAMETLLETNQNQQAA